MRNLCGPGDEDDDDGDEVTQLGEVSTDTHGYPFGHMWDGGLGVRLP